MRMNQETWIHRGMVVSHSSMNTWRLGMGLLKDISSQKRNTNLRDCLVPIFNNCFLFLKTKNIKNLFGEGGVFLFFFLYFLCSQKPLFFYIYNNKNIFSIFFHFSNNRLFFLFYLPSFCVFLTVFCIFTKMSSTQPPHSHPQTLSSSLNY